MGLQIAICATCGTSAHVQNYAELEWSGWQWDSKGVESGREWICSSCVFTTEDAQAEYERRQLEQEKALAEAYDLETCRRFHMLMRRMRVTGWLSQRVEAIGNTVVGAVEWKVQHGFCSATTARDEQLTGESNNGSQF